MKNIEILQLPPYYYPERISSTHLTDDLDKAFYEAGFHTTAYAPTPCRGIDKETRKKYKKIKHEVLENGSCDLYRFPLFKEGKNPIGRAVRYIICNVIQYYCGCNARNIDIIFAGSTPPTQGMLCGLVARKLSKKYRHKVPFIYSLQDVFPDSLVAAGLTTKGSLIWKIGRRIEDLTYKNADRIIVISNDIKKNIINKGVSEDKIAVISNWIDTDLIHPVSRDKNILFDELGIDRSKFIVVYAGNLGMAQGIELLVDAAKQVTNVEFIIFGEGSNKEELINRSERIDNIRFFPLLPSSRVSEVYSLGDLSFVACKPGLGSGAVPSKTYSIMATATPILLSFDRGTELWNMIDNNNCGFCSEAGDIDQLIKNITFAYENKEVLIDKSTNARAYVEINHSRRKSTGEYVNQIKHMIDVP